MYFCSPFSRKEEGLFYLRVCFSETGTSTLGSKWRLCDGSRSYVVTTISSHLCTVATTGRSYPAQTFDHFHRRRTSLRQNSHQTVDRVDPSTGRPKLTSRNCTRVRKQKSERNVTTTQNLVKDECVIPIWVHQILLLSH